VVWLMIFAGVLPAATMRLVITGSLRSALNRPKWWRWSAHRQGLRVLARSFPATLCRHLRMVRAGGFGRRQAGRVPRMVKADSESFVVLFLVSVGFWYFTYMICALIGYTMYQYASRLDISVSGLGERSLRSVATARTVDVKARRRDAMIGQLVSSGDVRDAIKLVQQDLQDRPNDLSLHARLHKLVIAEGSGLRIDDQTDKYLNLLVKSQNWSEALQLYQDGVARRPEWSPREAHRGRAGAGCAAGRQAADRRRADQGLRQEVREHPDIQKVYLVGAQLMAEFASKPDERASLQYLLQKYSTRCDRNRRPLPGSHEPDGRDALTAVTRLPAGLQSRIQIQLEFRHRTRGRCARTRSSRRAPDRHRRRLGRRDPAQCRGRWEVLR
jgi:hypothetical protein